jgi:hypothetical protein
MRLIGGPAEQRKRLRPLQNDPDQENQGANNPNEDLGILGPLPIFHFVFAFSPNATKRRIA